VHDANCSRKKLNGFSFLSSNIMPEEISRSLLADYPGLTHIQCARNDGMAFFQERDPSLEPLNLRSIDLELTSPEGLKAIISDMCQYACTTLKCLSLSVPSRTSNDSFAEAFDAGIRSAVNHTTGATPLLAHLQEIALYGFDLSKLYKPLSLLSDLGSLSRLTLFRCNGVIKFLADIERRNNGQALNLKHLVLQFLNEPLEEGSAAMDQDARKCLSGVFHSSSLRSLHLSWKSESSLKDFLSDATSFAPDLISFSTHGGLKIDNDDPRGHDHTPTFDDIRAMLANMPKLQAFGVEIPEFEMGPHNLSGQYRMRGVFMVRT
jgi:hypothetical protein